MTARGRGGGRAGKREGRRGGGGRSAAGTSRGAGSSRGKAVLVDDDGVEEDGGSEVYYATCSIHTLLCMFVCCVFLNMFAHCPL
jgi:hypothetical protein